MRYFKLILIITFGVIAVLALAFYAFWAILFFPDDFSVTREEALQHGHGPSIFATELLPNPSVEP